MPKAEDVPTIGHTQGKPPSPHQPCTQERRQVVASHYRPHSLDEAGSGQAGRGTDSLWNAYWENLCQLRPAWRDACCHCFQPWLRAGPGPARATEALQEKKRDTGG